MEGWVDRKGSSGSLWMMGEGGEGGPGAGRWGGLGERWPDLGKPMGEEVGVQCCEDAVNGRQAHQNANGCRLTRGAKVFSPPPKPCA